ncbi:MAG: hypothetical protein LLG06_03245 [Desulfobacteraceae bacterium]|nr:hypothetical protein [Desulfobacteraceae bacterium]
MPTLKTIHKCVVSALFLFCCLFLFGAPVAFAETEVEEYNMAIWNTGARWVAAETPVTQLPDDRRLMRLGVTKQNLVSSPATVTSTRANPRRRNVTPASLDYRTYGYITPVRDQGDCVSCWAFATVATLESQQLMASAGSQSTLDLAEQLLVSCSGAGNCSGGYVDDASDYIRDTGLPIEACFPYTEANGTCSQAACPNWRTDTSAIKGWHWVATTSPDASTLKSALYSYGPLTTTMDVYADFYSYSSGVYSHVSGDYQGGHAILIVGYDDENECFIVKNSWGPGWGESGYFRIAYSQLAPASRFGTGGCEFGYYTIAYDGYKHIYNSTCTYTVAPTAVSTRAVTTNGTVTVTTQPGCAWTAKSNASWITIKSGASGTGSGTVQYMVIRNAGQARTGTMTIAGQTVTVYQARR